MPRLLRLSGTEIIDILRPYGFEVISIKGSHHKLRRIQNGEKQPLLVAVHGKSPLSTETLRSIYRDAARYISENELRRFFYAE